MRSLVIVLVLTAGISAQTQTPALIRINISGHDAKVIADALNTLQKSRDPLVADTVAKNIVNLTDAMAASGRVNEIGPLTGDEHDLIDLRAFMEKYAFPGGPILIRPRNLDSTPGPRLFSFTPSSFIAMCADMASNPIVQLRVVQETKMIVVARLIVDLNEQQDKVISERAVLEGALAGFKNQDRKGVIIGRVQGIADALAVNAAENAPYDLVTPEREAAFCELTTMDRDVFDEVPRPLIGMVNVSYDGKTYATTPNHFVWFFIRFLLADQDALDPGIRARRTQLGADLLDHLSDQLQARVIQSVLDLLNKPGPPGPDGLALGDFYARGPGLDAVKKAPGLSQLESTRGPDYRVLAVSTKQLSSLPALREWLERGLSKRHTHQTR